MSRAATPDTSISIPSAGRDTLHAWTARHGQVLPASQQVAVFLRGTQGTKLIASHPASLQVLPWLAGIAARAIAQREPVAISRHSDEGPAREAIAHPLYQQKTLVGAVVLLRDGAQPVTPDDMASLAASALEFPDLMRQGLGQPAPARDGQRVVLSLMEKTAASRNAKEAAETLAVGLAGHLACERVSVGLRTGRSTTVLANSNSSAVASLTAMAQRPAAAEEIAAAMDEAADQGCTLVNPADPARRLCMLAAHRQLSEVTHAPYLCTVPLVAGGEVVGALLAEKREAAFTPADVALLEQAAATFGTLLHLMHERERPWRQRLSRSLAASLRHAGAGRHRLAALVIGVVLAIVLLSPVDREVMAPVKLEGAVQRIVAAPDDNYLEKVHVRPGDVVKQGQLLLEFTAEDLRVERQRLTAELASREAAAAEAMSKQELAALAVQGAKVRESRAQLELLDQRLARLKVTAPFDAVVIQGDLSNAQGAPTRKGDLLMTLAPADSFRAIVEIDESDVGEVRVGQTGAMVLTALPHDTLPVRVKAVTPLAVVSQGRSYFEVEVDVPSAKSATKAGAAELRPGMRGIARLQSTQRARGAVWAEQAMAWCRLAWWRWVG